MTNLIFIGFGFVLFMYFCFVSLYTKNPFSFSLFWLLGAVCCFGIVLLDSFSLIYLFFELGILILSLLICINIFFIIKQIYSAPYENVDYLIILGAGLKGEQITKSLQFRLETALTYLKVHPNTIAIVSGGKGKGETITEAQAMKTYLIKNKISSNRIMTETHSTNTYENLLFSKELLPKIDSTVGIVTSNFHLYRAMQIAKKLNFKSPVGLPAPTDPFLFIHFMVREVFAFIKDKSIKNI